MIDAIGAWTRARHVVCEGERAAQERDQRSARCLRLASLARARLVWPVAHEAGMEAGHDK